MGNERAEVLGLERGQEDTAVLTGVYEGSPSTLALQAWPRDSAQATKDLETELGCCLSPKNWENSRDFLAGQ